MGRFPLYRVEDYLAETDVPPLLGQGRAAEDFSDDSLGRASDKLSEAGSKAVFTTMAAQAYTREHISLQSVHWDSSSLSMHGVYTNENIPPRYPSHPRDWSSTEMHTPPERFRAMDIRKTTTPT